ncbi:MAG: hypothetical protein GY801_14535 [bacterium]|nr:hypothetical protein [bacterium]
MQKSPIFELIDGTSADITPDVLGLWTTRPRPSPEGVVSFDAAQSDPDDMSQTAPVWRVNLPMNLDLAAAHLARGKRALTQSQQAIQKAPEQISDLIRTRIPSSSQSFAVPAGVEDSEQKLLTVLSVLQPEGQVLSFGLGDQLSATWRQNTEQFHVFGDTLIQSFTQYVWVETCVQNSCLGRSHVGWTGDLRTTWRRDLSKEQMKLHRDALVLALASRDSVIQSFALAMRVAVQLAALIASPGSAVFLIPTVWKYIQRITSGTKE